LGWLEQIGPKTERALLLLQPPFDRTGEELAFATYGAARNFVRDVRIGDVKLRRGHICTIATSWRIIFIDTYHLKPYSFRYEDLVRIEKPTGGGVMKDIKYKILTKSTQTIELTIRVDAPGLLGVFAGFGNPAIASHVMDRSRVVEVVINFFNAFFTRIVP
jgi:hypothetical protein